MFCMKCGKSLPDGSTFCSECGAQLNAPVVENQQNAFGGGFTPAPAPAPAPVQEEKKTFFTGTNIAYIIVLVLTIIGAVLLATSFSGITSKSIDEFPVISIVGIDFNNFKDELKESHAQINEEYYKELMEGSNLNSDQQKAIERFLKSMKSLSKTFSIENLKNLVSASDKVLDKLAENKGVEDAFYINMSFGSADSFATGLLNAVSTIILIFMLVCLAFNVFGGIFKIKGLVITGLVFSLMYTLIFCSVLLAVAIFIIDIGAVVAIKFAKPAKED